MSKYKKIFKQFLDKTGGRYTEQKEDILDVILKTKTHFEVEELLLKMFSTKQLV